MQNEAKREYSLSDIKPPFYPCPVSEQETVIQISRDGETAHIRTNDLTMLAKCRRATNAKGSEWKLVEIQYMGGRQYGWGFECPKKLATSFPAKSLSKKGKAEESEEEEN